MLLRGADASKTDACSVTRVTRPGEPEPEGVDEAVRVAGDLATLRNKTNNARIVLFFKE